MKTPRFEYHAPRSVEEVLGLLAEHGDEAKVLAGGQSLVPLLAMRIARPAHLVDINNVEGLTGIAERNGFVAFGALAREREAEGSALVSQHLPVMAAALPHIGHISIRNRGTVCGSIAHADALAELPAVARITGAEMVVKSTTGERVVSAEDFFQGHFTTALGDEELLTEVRMPKGPAGAGWAFEEVARRRGDFALVGVAAMVALDGAGKVAEGRLCLIGVADRPLQASAAEASLVGREPSAENLVAAAEEAVRDLEPPSDIHGSGEYRRQLARVTVRRSLEAAASRAGKAP
jgi:carbon-monoxide dehydrogenase medium subunit